MRNLLNYFWPSDYRRKSSNSYMEVADLIHFLQESSNEIQVFFERDSSPRKCTISAFSPKHNLFVVDTSRSEKAYIPPSQGEQASISTVMNGQNIIFKSQFHEAFLDGDNSRYQMKALSVAENNRPFTYFRTFFDDLQSLRTRFHHTVK